ncbi:MAG: ABC transporter ATP-binding protein [Clostridia bacterium]|nr:ABC transporter ATP-binding protein [Clostridia bacterium]
MNMIEIRSLKKSFGDVDAVKDVSFSVKEGELFAFLGVNGAGKSTTISIICGVLPRDGGNVTVGGYDIDKDGEKIKGLIGVVFQNSVLDRALTGRDNLRSRAALYSICGKDFEDRLNELSALLDLGEILDRPIRKLSGGQRRRIDIARALLHKPRLLILDEPTTGLDPQTRKNVWEIVDRLRIEENMTVFLTTHYMEEAAEADNVVIIESGSIAAVGTPNELKNRYAGDYMTVYGVSEEQVRSFGYPYEVIGDAIRISIPSSLSAAELIRKYPEIIVDFEVVKGKMDDVFLSVTGRRQEDN